MKKFCLAVLILAVFSGVIFFIGLSSLKIKTDETGVVISKTSGISPEPVVSGKLCWNWQFLLPTNAVLKKFSIKPLNVTKKISGELSNDNPYSFTFEISLTASPESIISLLKQNKISDEKDFEKYLENATGALAQMTANYYLNRKSQNPSFQINYARREDILRAINFSDEYPELILSSFSLTDFTLPDFETNNNDNSDNLTGENL